MHWKTSLNIQGDKIDDIHYTALQALNEVSSFQFQTSRWAREFCTNSSVIILKWVIFIIIKVYLFLSFPVLSFLLFFFYFFVSSQHPNRYHQNDLQTISQICPLHFSSINNLQSLHHFTQFFIICILLFHHHFIISF